jgi:HEAT repeat protein
LHVLGGLPQDAARVVPLLLDGMKDQLLDVRLAAIEAFARLGPEAKDAIPVLTAAAKNDSQGVVRDAAAEALKKIQPNP